MTDERLSELLDERAAAITTVDLVDRAWQRAHVVRRRRVLAGVAVAVVAIVGGTTVVVNGAGDNAAPPPAESPSTPGAVRAGKYSFARVWWGPTTEEEAALPELPGTALPPTIDLSAETPVPPGQVALAVFQVWGDRPGAVVVLGADGATYALDTSRLGPITDHGQIYPVVREHSLSPDGRYAVFPQDGSLEVYDFREGRWTSIPVEGPVAFGVHWSEGGTAITVPRPGTGPLADTYSPRGRHYPGSAFDEDDYFSLRANGDSGHGPVVRTADDDGARGFGMGGPVEDLDGAQLYGVDAIGAVGKYWPKHLLAFPFEPGGGRWKQCCPAVGWADGTTLLFESRWAHARILAWRVGTPEIYRVSDIRGWTPGKETYVASFATLD